MEDKSATLFLEKEPLGKLMSKFCIPCIVSLLVATLYNIVDQLFIANADYLGSNGNAANSVVFPLTIVALGLAMLIGDGGCTIASIALGAGNQTKARRTIGCSITCLVIIGIVLMAIYLIFPDQILTLFGGRVNETTFAMAKEYFFWIALGIPFYVFGQAMNPIVRADGSPKFAMAALVIGAVINLGLDPLFIYVFKWGMFGAALATIIGQIVAALMFVAYAFKMKSVKLDPDSLKPRFKLIRQIVPQGTASMLTQLAIVLSMAIVFNIINKYKVNDPIFSQEEYSQIPTAVVGITMKFFQVVISVAIGMVTGCFSLAGYNLGAKRPDRVRRLMFLLNRAELIYGLAMSIVFLLFPSQLFGIFGAGNESTYYMEYAVKCLRIFMGLSVLACFNKGVAIYQQAIGNPKMATFLSLFREIVFGAGLPFVLPILIGLDGILWFMPISDLVVGIISIIVTIRTAKQLKAQEKELIEAGELIPENAKVITESV